MTSATTRHFLRSRSRFGGLSSSILLVWALLVFLPSSLFGETGGEALGPGDVVKLEVFGETDLSGNFTVRDDGTLKINWMEPVAVGGMTADQAQEALRAFIDKKYVIDPKVNLVVAEFRSRTVSFMGEVSKPGVVPLRKDSTLLSALLSAGGPTKQAASELIILHPMGEGKQDYESTKVSLDKVLSQADPLHNRALQPGDIIYVPSSQGTKNAEETVYVLGAVTKGGSYGYRAGLTALDAVLEAGGVTKFASPNGTKIYRGWGDKRTVVPVKLGDVLKKGDRRKNVELRAGDLMIVPEGIL